MTGVQTCALPIFVKLPPKLRVLAASFRVTVRVLPAVRFSVLAIVKSKAPVPVERIPREVIAVCVPPLIVGAVSVLLVKVSVVARPTKVSVAAGRVNTPEAVADANRLVVPDVEPEKLTPVVPNVGRVERTTVEPVPVTELIPLPLTWNTLPVPAVLNVLLVNV